DAKVELGEGAEGSKVATGSDDVKAEISNETKGDVTVSDSTGKETTVGAGETTKTEEPAKPTTPTTPTVPSGGSDNSGTYNPPVQPVETIYTFKIKPLAATGQSEQTVTKGQSATFYGREFKYETLVDYCEKVQQGKTSVDVTVDGQTRPVTVTKTSTGYTISAKAFSGKTYTADVTVAGTNISITQTAPVPPVSEEQ
ncbi:MAG: hypothetical protein MSA09_11540, partial [Lachnospiraceae bacterium]|nr:hypothetical protein [Lachnospiraceae bacterium]